MITKKSQSQVISVILIVLLTVVAVSIIGNFVIGFIKEKTNEDHCVDIISEAEIIDSEYTCYNESGKFLLIKISIGEIEDKLGGFAIDLGEKTYKIKNGESEISMYSGGEFTLPKNNEARTYKISNVNTIPETIKLHLLTKKEKYCEASDSLEGIRICP
jgi:hypothetical protein